MRVLVPSAKLADPALQSDFGPLPPSLLPIGGMTVVGRIRESWGGAETAVAVHEGADAFPRLLPPEHGLTIVDVGETGSLAATILAALDRLPGWTDASLILNLGDTVVEGLDPALGGTDFALGARTEESQRWTLFREEDGVLGEISDKELQARPETWRAFVGVFGFAEPARLVTELRRKNDFYAALRVYAEASESFTFPEAPLWLDCGHADNFYAARKRLINTRYFNTLRFDETEGTIRKSSSNKAKLADEIAWAVELPRPLRRFIPTVYDHSTEPEGPFIEMEFTAYPSLDECFVYARFDHDAWQKAFARIFELVGRFGQHTFRDPRIDADLREMFLAKTCDRLRQIEADPPFPCALLDRPLMVDGVACPPFRQVMDELEDVLEGAGLLHTEHLQVIHGDLCFGNILFDHKHGLLKVIDPRGRFGRHLHYGDVRYDLAKLSHSALGLYDLVVLERFHVQHVSEDAYRIDFRQDPYHRAVGEIFRHRLAREGHDLRAVRLLESLLFLSMVPLHCDHPHRQLAMFLRGMTIHAQHREARP